MRQLAPLLLFVGAVAVTLYQLVSLLPILTRRAEPTGRFPPPLDLLEEPAASVRADQLLRRAIGEREWKQYQETHILRVKSRRTRGRYYYLHPASRIWVGGSRGPRTHSICVVPGTRHTREQVLAQQQAGAVVPVYPDTTTTADLWIVENRHPMADQLLIQWLLCKYDEERLWSVGVVTPE